MLAVAAAPPHPRDARLSFDEHQHAYWVDGVRRVSESVTAVWESYFPKFAPEATIASCIASWRANPNSRYAALLQYLLLVHGADDAAQRVAIAALWEANRAHAAALGTALHRQIEAHLLTGRLPAPAEHGGDGGGTAEFRQYLQWRAETAWTPLRAEWRIFDDHASVAGTIDSLWRDDDGRLVIVDWKRTKRGALEQKAFRGETGWGPCAAMPNTPRAHYTMQQSLYACILARSYGLRVDRAMLVQLHPDLKTYNAVQVPLRMAEATAMLDARDQGHPRNVEQPPPTKKPKPDVVQRERDDLGEAAPTEKRATPAAVGLDDLE